MGKVILHLLAGSAYWNLSKVLIKHLGLIETLVLTDLIDKNEYYGRSGSLQDGKWFFYTREEMEEQLRISHSYQRTILNKLRDLGLIDMKIEGMPRKTYYCINEDAIQEYFSSKLDEE